jgi:Flp pilus assembly protein protease CpaA
MQDLTNIIQTAAALITLILATIWDIRYRRIPNAVTLPAILFGLVLTAVFQINTMPLTVIILILLFLFGALGMMGQGDIKLIMALIAISGLNIALISTGIAALLVVAVQFMLYPDEFFKDVKIVLKSIFIMNFKNIDKNGRSVPFAPYILIGFAYFTVYRLFLI